jgi:hypothetical protein
MERRSGNWKRIPTKAMPKPILFPAGISCDPMMKFFGS